MLALVMQAFETSLPQSFKKMQKNAVYVQARTFIRAWLITPLTQVVGLDIDSLPSYVERLLQPHPKLQSRLQPTSKNLPTVR